MRYLPILVVCGLIVANAPGQTSHGDHGKPSASAVTLVDGVGRVDHKVSTTNPEAQKFFNQGLAYLYAFNHEAGVASFHRAAELDPTLAMAHWGIALGLGANYNDPANPDRFAQAYMHLQKAKELAGKASEAERAYIDALGRRYSSDPAADRQKLAADYRQAMGELVKRYPDDLDAATLYAESMMNLRPWQLWTHDGQPAEGTPEILAVLESVLKRDPRHTGANHYYIHAIEAGPNPERGIAAANRLGALAPAAGHLVHMPSHIYLRTGDFVEAAKSNDLAIVADRNYIAKSGAAGLYPLMYYNHNIHMLAASYAGNGNYAGAIKASRELEANVRPNLAAMPMLEMFMPYPLITLTRFQKWDEILREPKPAESLKITTAFWHFARGMAFSSRGKAADAKTELGALKTVAGTIPADTGYNNNKALTVLKVAEEMLAGSAAMAGGDTAAGIAGLRRAAAAEDAVNYAEPPDWHVPVREWLGAALIRSGDPAGAEKVYREELVRNPRGGRALFGLAEALRKQGKTDSAAMVEKEFAGTWEAADTKLAFDGYWMR